MRAVDIAVRGEDLMVVVVALNEHRELLRAKTEDIGQQHPDFASLQCEIGVAERLMDGLMQALCAPEENGAQVEVADVC